MGLEMETGSVTVQLDLMNHNMSQMIDRAERVLFCVSDIEDTADVLKGQTYDAIRNYFGKIHTMVLRGVIILAEEMIQENNTYKGCISAKLGGIGYVNEDGLRDSKEEMEKQLERVYGLIDAKRGLYYTDWIGSLQRVIELIKKKLDQIEDFKASTSGLYQNISAYQENVKRGIECLHSAVFDGSTIYYPADYINTGWMNSIEKEWENREKYRNLTIKEPFINIMVKEFGFDRVAGTALYKLYENMDMRGVENINQKYLAMIASVSYPYDEKYKMSFNYLWHYLAGTDTPDQVKTEMLLYGLEEHEINSVFGCIGANHDNSSKEEEDLTDPLLKIYLRKIDMAHMAVTMATILKPDETFFEQLGDLSGCFNGIYDLNANAGYVGDVYGTGGNGPKLTPDDYKADLDAVNLSARLENESNLILVMNRYYSEIGKGETNRAEEFVKNFGQGDYEAGLAVLIKQANEHMTYLKEHNDLELPIEQIEERKKVVANFILNLEYKNNEFEKIIKFNENLAEGKDY